MRIHRGDPHRVATVLPGRGYTPHMPLLYFTTALLHSRGWTVQEVWWDEISDPDHVNVAEVAEGALHDDPDVLQLLVGKSLGTLAIPVAARQSLPGIWLTPLVRKPEIADAITVLQCPSLLVGGTADEYWAPPKITHSAVQVLELAGADHGLEAPKDPAASIPTASSPASASSRRWSARRSRSSSAKAAWRASSTA